MPSSKALCSNELRQRRPAPHPPEVGVLSLIPIIVQYPHIAMRVVPRLGCLRQTLIFTFWKCPALFANKTVSPLPTTSPANKSFARIFNLYSNQTKFFHYFTVHLFKFQLRFLHFAIECEERSFHFHQKAVDEIVLKLEHDSTLCVLFCMFELYTD